jgi:RNA-directed DNA polymerase
MLNKEKLLHDLFQAYYEARKNKRNTLNQLDFEFNLETNLIELYEELIN